VSITSLDFEIFLLTNSTVKVMYRVVVTGANGRFALAMQVLAVPA
jgi:hypothetical protein